MQTRIKLINPNDPLSDEDTFDFMEAQVGFWDEANTPHRGAIVTVFIEKQDISISEIKKIATQKAREFLAEAIK